MKFVAIDFETADFGADSACSVALVRVVDGVIVDRCQRLIRPPRQRFEFTYIHHITWDDVRDQPTFAELWPELRSWFDDIDFICAHNAPFDRGVLSACCAKAGVAMPAPQFQCTVVKARQTWGIFPTKLPNVCTRLGIPLNHHDAASDAEACARIMMMALEEERKKKEDPAPKRKRLVLKRLE